MENNAQNIRMIAIENIIPNPNNPRKDLGDLTELADSIKTAGLMQPLTVVPADEGKHMLVIGHRRTEAAKIAGLTELPCIVTNIDDKTQLCIMLMENMQRKDITAKEQADSFEQLTLLGMSEEDISKKTGFSRTTIKHRLELAKLDKETFATKDGEYQFSLTALMALEEIKDIETRNKVLKEATNDNDLVFRAHEAQKAEIKAEKIKALTALALAEGFKEDTSYKSHQWDGNLEKVRTIQLYGEIEVPDTFSLDDLVAEGTDVYFGVSDYSFVVFYKDEDTKTEEEKAEIKDRKEKEKLRDKLRHETNALAGELASDIKSFIKLVVDGTIHGVSKKNESNLIAGIWNYFSLMGYCSPKPVSYHNLVNGTNAYYLSQEETAEAETAYKALPIWKQMLVATPTNFGDFCAYYGTPLVSNISKAEALVTLLTDFFGFSLDEKYTDIMNPASSAYLEAEEDDDEVEDDDGYEGEDETADAVSEDLSEDSSEGTSCVPEGMSDAIVA